MESIKSTLSADFFKFRDCRRDTSAWKNAENQTDTAYMMQLSDSRDCDADGDCGERLDKL